MNDFIAPLILAVIQGITEWFPVSSSGHLVLFSRLLGYDNTLSFDIALHFGTLMAVFVYFGKDIMNIIRDVCRLRFSSADGKMGLYLIIATIPAAIMGYLFQGLIEAELNNMLLLAMGFAITSVLLYSASLPIYRRKKELSFKIALFIGLAQVASLFRGVSRSGSTIASGVLLGLDQKKAARFSFLMSIPIIFGASVLTLGSQTLSFNYLWASLVSFFVGLATIHVLLRFVLTSNRNLRWFALYTFILAVAIFSWLLFF